LPNSWRAYQVGLAQKPADALDLGLDDGHAGPNALVHRRTFELSEGAGHLEQQLASRGGGIDRLLVEVVVDADGLEMLDRAGQIDQITCRARVFWAFSGRNSVGFCMGAKHVCPGKPPNEGKGRVDCFRKH
jgi:hypothetical protein